MIYQKALGSVEDCLPTDLLRSLYKFWMYPPKAQNKQNDTEIGWAQEFLQIELLLSLKYSDKRDDGRS